MIDSIVFLGKYDDFLHSLEEKVVNLNEKLNKKIITPNILSYPDMVNYFNEKYHLNVWVIIGDVKPTLLLKDLISKSRLIIFVFNLAKQDTLQFLIEGWRPIIEKADRNKLFNQERFLVGTNSSNMSVSRDSINLEIQNAYNLLKCNKYFEEKLNEDLNFIEKIQVFTNVLEQIHEKFKKNLNQNIYSLENEHTKNESNLINENQIEKTIENNDDIEFESNNVIYEEESEKIRINYQNKFNCVLFRKNKTAEIIESPEAKGEIIIPKYIIHQSIKYNITKINDKSFSKTLITSLSFEEESEVEYIGNNVFENSTIEYLSLPPKLKNLSENWCCHIEKLNKIDINYRNEYFKIQDNLLLSNNGTILFAPRNFIGDYFVPKEVICLNNFSFENCKSLSSITIDNEYIYFNNFCFKNCENLSSISINNISYVELGICPFIGCKKLNELNMEPSNKNKIKKYFEQNEKRIGIGSNGKTYKITKKGSEVYIAEKISNIGIDNSNEVNSFFKKMILFSNLNNPIILPIIGFGFCLRKGKYNQIIFTKLMKKSLSKISNQLTETQKYIIILGIALGMKYLNMNNIYHNNLKPSNILLDENYYPYITDYGQKKNSDKNDIYDFALIIFKLVTDKEYDVLNLHMVSKENLRNLLRKCFQQKITFQNFVKLFLQNEHKEEFNANEQEISQYLKSINIIKEDIYTENVYFEKKKIIFENQIEKTIENNDYIKKKAKE